MFIHSFAFELMTLIQLSLLVSNIHQDKVRFLFFHVNFFFFIK